MPSTRHPVNDWDSLGSSGATRSERLRGARKAAGYASASMAAKTFGWSVNTYSSNENGNAPYSYKTARLYGAAFGVRAEWLYEGEPPMVAAHDPAGDGDERLVPVIGHVGADAQGAVLFALGQTPGDLVPIPPGGTDQARALLVTGGSMPGLADHGALIYFEYQRTPPSPDMLGHVVVVETETEEVLVKRLLRGARAGLFDLESLAGPTRRDCRLRWAAHITAIIPPWQARRILRTHAA
ncbi:helix-turn-helix transcriptional regulator [Phenylobacterium sp.]|jgi:phage repressor protein C with HTH and peptisase S24 domain|uniref:helix-turn-helix transcriptional regulator n=1 Tax=Phenylobacterium sp. TaxID=1871053 RepID=UPI002F416009